MYPRDARPESAIRWLPDGATVTLVCTREGVPYRVIVNLEEVRWEWGQLDDRGWIPVAPLKRGAPRRLSGTPALRVLGRMPRACGEGPRAAEGLVHRRWTSGDGRSL